MVKKVLIVFGTRPEAIKMAPLVKQFAQHSSRFLTRICVTSQHREMLDQVLKIFEIHPDYDLDIMKPDQDLFDITSMILLKIRDVLDDFHPDLVMVHGDTSTSVAAALAAFYHRIPVAHVEAGLRSGNIYAPWPEEMNRKITGALSTLHFVPTTGAKNNLLKENVNPDHIFVTGNTVIDALYMISAKIRIDKTLERRIIDELDVTFENRLSQILKSKYVLVTGHRRENFGKGFISICESLKELALKYPDISIIYPVHLNPNVRIPVFEMLGDLENIFLIPPLSYLSFVFLMERCHFILTDSGGIQEEAPAFGKPVLVMRENTERPEAVNAGTVKLVGTNRELILDYSSRLIEDSWFYKSMAQASNPFGDGTASQKIINQLNICYFP